MRHRAWAIAGLVPAVALAGAGEAVVEWPVDPATTVVLVEDHRAPVVHVALEFGAGSWMPWFRENHVEEAFEIQDHDAEGELRHRADLLAARVRLSVGRRTSLLSLDCHTEVLSEALDLVRDLLANRDFDRKTLKRWNQTRSIGWKASLKEPAFVLRQAGARRLFGAQDPRRFDVEQPPPVRMDVERLADARDTLIRLPGRVIGFAGAVTRADAERLASTLLPAAFSTTPSGLDPLPLRPAPLESQPHDVDVFLPRLTQTYLGHGRLSLAMEDVDYPASLLADHILGGHFNSRLMVALRQEGGDTYGAGVIDEGSEVAGLYALATFTRSDNTENTETRMREVLREFWDRGISEAERAAAAGHALGARAFARQAPEQLLATYLGERRLGLPHGFRDRMAEKAAALSVDEVNAFIKRFHDPAGFITVRVRSR